MYPLARDYMSILIVTGTFTGDMRRRLVYLMMQTEVKELPASRKGL